MADKYFFLLVVVFILCGCNEGTQLGGGYYLQDHDADHIYIHKRTDDSMFLVIDSQVIGYAVQGQFILVHRMIADSYECLDDAGDLTIITHHAKDEEYWIIYSETGEKVGPYSDSEFHIWAKSSGLESIEFHQIVRYRSNSSWFNSQVSKCQNMKKISF